MPISREAFEKGLSPLEEKVIDFLKENSDSAFTSREIASSLNVELTDTLKIVDWRLTLLSLLLMGHVNSSKIGGDIYYAYSEVKP